MVNSSCFPLHNSILSQLTKGLGWGASSLKLLDKLRTPSREVIASNMRKASSLTLGILKSLYLKADLDATGEGFVATCLEEEAADLV
jgi:hypothetical protein